MFKEFELEGERNSVTSPTFEDGRPRKSWLAPESTLPWFLSIAVASRPRCFGCGGRLLPKVVVIVDNFALCEKCSTTDWSDFQPYWRALESRGPPLELSRSRGVTFWTPPATLPDMDAYIRWLKLRAIMRHRDDPAASTA